MWLNRINEDGRKSGVYADYKYFGTGDRGGRAARNTVAMDRTKSLAGGGPVRVIEGSSDQICKDISPAQAAKLPTYKGELELVNHSAGSISSEAYMKRWNRKNEQLANAAESAATAAAWLGAFPYPNDAILSARGTWCSARRCMTSCPAPAYRRHMNTHGMTRCWRSINSPRLTERATAAVVSTLDTRVQGVPVAVYNPLAMEREDPVDATFRSMGRRPRR